MLRVVLRVQRISLRIKEAVHVHVIVKKEHRHFLHCKPKLLVGGFVRLGSTSEFFVAKDQPSFDLEVIISMSTIKKMGGHTEIKLDQYKLNNSNRITLPLEKSPDSKGSIQIDFMQLETDVFISGISLFSLYEYESYQNKKLLQKQENEYSSLTMQHQKLQNQIKELKNSNQSLSSQTLSKKMQFDQIEKGFSKELILKQQEKESALASLQKQKKKIAEIIDIVNESGNAELIGQIEEIVCMKQQGRM